jgi:DNA-binding GntR family transcriptional regulator
LARLAHEGLVVREPNRRATVASMSRQDLEEVGTLRLALELLALKFAVENATADDLATLDGYVSELHALLGSSFTIQEAVDLDLRIHEALVSASRHSRIISFWQSLRSQIWLIIFSHNLYDIGGFPREGAVLHGLIVDAVRRRDLATGQRELEKHLQATFSNLVARYEERKGVVGHEAPGKGT